MTILKLKTWMDAEHASNWGAECRSQWTKDLIRDIRDATKGAYTDYNSSDLEPCSEILEGYYSALKTAKENLEAELQVLDIPCAFERACVDKVLEPFQNDVKFCSRIKGYGGIYTTRKLRDILNPQKRTDEVLTGDERMMIQLCWNKLREIYQDSWEQLRLLTDYRTEKLHPVIDFKQAEKQIKRVHKGYAEQEACRKLLHKIEDVRKLAL